MHDISCLIITQPERETLLQESLLSLSRQTLPAEAVIVVQDDVFAKDVETECSHLKIPYNVICAEPRASLGALRNIAIEEAGRYWCQWDDDDLYHPKRLEEQFKVLNGTIHYSFLSSQLYLFTEKRRLFIRDCEFPIHGTILCKRNNIRYLNVYKGEDTHFFVEVMKQPARVDVINDFTLYLRRYHGDNTWDEEFHVNNLVRKGMSTEGVIANKEKIIEACAQLGVSGVQVWSRTKKVFEI